MTGTFNTPADNAGQENNGFGNAGNVDNNLDATGNVEPNYQSQIHGMEKRINDKDTHISTIETENMSLRQQMADAQAKVEQMGSIDEALERMQQQNQNASNQDTALDENALIERTLQAIATQKKQTKSETNFQAVAAELSKTFGADAADDKMRQVAEDNGLALVDMFDLARKSPAAVYKMAGLNVTQNVTGQPTRSTYAGFNDNDNETTAKDAKLAEFSKLRRENPREYWKADTQKEFRKLFN
jgi:hypothetical protein